METPVSLLDHLRKEPSAAAWNRLVQLYTPFLERWLGAHNLQPADRADIVQEILKSLVAELPRFEHSGRKGAFRAWLRETARHRLLKFWADRKRVAGVAADLDQMAAKTDSLMSVWDHEHDRRIAQRMFDLLESEFDARTVRAFRQRVEQGLPAREVAAQLGMTVNAVHIAKSRVLARLRQEVQGIVDE